MENNQKKEKKIISSGELKGYNRCDLRRKSDLPIERGKGSENVFEKAVLIKDMIRKKLFGVADNDEIEATLEMNFQNMDYPTEETAKLNAADAFRQIMRYTSSEDRVPDIAESKVVRPFDLFDVKVKPDYIFTGVKDFEYKQTVGKKTTTFTVPQRYIEVVKIKCSKPNVSITGKQKDEGMMQCLELYTMLLYARSLVKPGEQLNVCASYYFLRKNSDNSATKTFNSDFFDNKGAGNIVTLWEAYTSGMTTDIDAIFKPQFEEFAEGEHECSGKTCDGCDFYEICNYTKPPKMIPEEHTVSGPVKAGTIKLTKMQQDVVDFRKGIACVNAGAGAGKTTCIALRTANLIKEEKHPEKICMLTFTNTGAEEMRNRIGLYLKEYGLEKDAHKITSTTFNAFGYDIVKKHYEELGFSKEPGLVDEIERSAMIAEILKESDVIDGLDYRNFNANLPFCKGALVVMKKLFDIIKRDNLQSHQANEMYAALDSRFHGFAPLRSEDAKVFAAYEKYDKQLRDQDLIEYADQENLVFKMLEMHQDYFKAGGGYEHIIVDEFQDTNELQFELLKKLIDVPDFKSFMVVGDDSQSIFAFRGSSPEYIIHFFDALGMNGTKFDMTENHRSTKRIIDFANKINDLNKNKVEKELLATKEDGEPVEVNVFWKKNEDLEFARDMIRKEHENGMAYEDIAYIAYTRNELLKMATLLTEAEIPCVMLNPEPMLENSRVIAAIALVKFMCDPDATKQALIYTNAKHKGDVLNEDSTKIKNEIQDLDQYITVMLDEEENVQISKLKGLLSAIDDDDEVYEKFMQMVFEKKDFDRMLNFCISFELYGQDQTCKREHYYPGVVLTTAHSSKGKEWPVVINNLSSYHSKELRSTFTAAFEERRRLLFVSATRAKKKLYLIGQAVAFGSKKENDRTLNEFLVESCTVLGQIFPPEPTTEKKGKK